MSRAYDIRAARRARERERDLCGETLAEYQARAHAKAPTLQQVYRSHPKVRCDHTPNLFDGRTEHDRRNPPRLF